MTCNLNFNSGFTSGICAAGACKASAVFLHDKIIPEHVIIKNLDGKIFNLKVFHENNNKFYVIKNSGEAQDITNGIKIFAEINLNDEHKINFQAGEGVGIITLPGLKIPVGEPAINPVPRKIIINSIREIFKDDLNQGFNIKISIPNGEQIAKNTFNPRLGIIGGLSILGTTGIIKNMNENALLESLNLELNMIKSLGYKNLYITFGNEGEKFLREILKVSGKNIIQCSNYPGHVIDQALNLNFESITISGHPGKLLKLASGSFITHSKISDGKFEALCTHLALNDVPHEIIKNIYSSNTTNEAIKIIEQNNLNFIWNVLARRISERCAERINFKIPFNIIFHDNNKNILGGHECK